MIGTLVPLSALTSSKQGKNDQGTFETGILFLDWLKKTGQNGWQMLPLHLTQLEKGSSTSRVPSPYKSYGIGLDPKYLSNSKVSDFVFRASDLEKFVTANLYWIDDYAFFCALSDLFGTDDWRRWEIGLRKRKKNILNKWRKKPKKEIDNHILIQYLLYFEYEKLKQKAKKLKISLIGDLPFYLPVQSPLVWAHQELFKFGKSGNLEFVSGIPNTPFAHFGRQIWGHPLYKWGNKKQSKEVALLWKKRLLYLSTLFDSIRFDHAKGLFEIGAIDPEMKKIDRYIKGPGYSIFKDIVLFGRKSGLSIFAEDSGEKLTELRIALGKLKIPGIKIFRFAFNERMKKVNIEYADILNYPKNTIAYTTTHDTETLVGYLQKLTLDERKIISATAKIAYNPDIRKFAQKIRNSFLNSPAKLIIIPIQDWLLTTDRINIPGTEKEKNDTNWQYKVEIPIEELIIA